MTVIDFPAGRDNTLGAPVVANPILTEKAAIIHELVRHTRELTRRTAENIVRIGQHLVEVRDNDDVGHGEWLNWIRVEFAWSDQTARRFIHLYELSRDGKFNTVLNLDLPLSVLYQLAAPKAEAPRQEIVERIETGEQISEEMVIQAITGRRKSQSDNAEPDSVETKNDDASASAEDRKAAYAAGEAADGVVERGPADGGDRGGGDHGADGKARPAHRSKIRALDRAKKLGAEVVKSLQGTSLESAHEQDELVMLNRGAAPGELLPEVRSLIERACAGEAVSAIEYSAELTGKADRLRILTDTLANYTTREIRAALPAMLKDDIVAHAVRLEKAHAAKQNRMLVKFIEAVIQATRTNEDATTKYQHIERLVRKFNCDGDVFLTHRMEASSFI